jgi:hypothetical protein
MVKDTGKAEGAAAGGVNTDEDRYPTVRQALHKVGQALPDEAVTVDRLELHVLANGEVNCKWWRPRSEEAEFVHIPDPTSG